MKLKVQDFFLDWWVRLRWFFNFKNCYQNWRYERQFKPGTFYLDHNYTPMILIELEKDGNLRGISLVDGLEIWSDAYHCDPRIVDEKTARNQVAVVQKDREQEKEEEEKETTL